MRRLDQMARDEAQSVEPVSYSTPNLSALATTAAAPAEAIVLGGMLGALGVVRSLARVGIRVTVVSDDRFDVAMASRHARHVLVPSLAGEGLLADLSRLRRPMAQAPVLIFTADKPMLTVSQVRDDLAGLFRFRLPPHDVLKGMTEKMAFYDVATAGGFPVPGTLLLRAGDDLSRIDRLQPPLALKPNERCAAYDAAFEKAYRVDSHAQARDLCTRMLAATPAVIVQEWVEGRNDAIYTCLQYLGDDFAVSFTNRKLRSWPYMVGISSSAMATPEVAGELEEITTRFFRHAGVSGFASMEYKRDRRTGRFVMIEPTVGRTNWHEETATLSGVNLPQVGYCEALGLAIPEQRLDPRHIWRNEFVDWASWWVGRETVSIPPGSKVHYAHWRWDDPLPAVVGAGRYVRNVWRMVAK